MPELCKSRESSVCRKGSVLALALGCLLGVCASVYTKDSIYITSTSLQSAIGAGILRPRARNCYRDTSSNKLVKETTRFSAWHAYHTGKDSTFVMLALN